MNFKKLQATQAKLDEAILADKAPMTAEERFNKTLVALSVEIAEVANCAEHFKFWKDNKGKVDSKRFTVTSVIVNNLIKDDYLDNLDNTTMQYVTEKQAHRLTLIEECSDALHFILSLANQCNENISTMVFLINDGMYSKEEHYRNLQYLINYMDYREEINFKNEWIRSITEGFCCYTYSLGVKFKELEQAYYDKNKINYERLENGY